jgi:hypothetical protein
MCTSHDGIMGERGPESLVKYGGACVHTFVCVDTFQALGHIKGMHETRVPYTEGTDIHPSLHPDPLPRPPYLLNLGPQVRIGGRRGLGKNSHFLLPSDPSPTNLPIASTVCPLSAISRWPRSGWMPACATCTCAPPSCQRCSRTGCCRKGQAPGYHSRWGEGRGGGSLREEAEEGEGKGCWWAGCTGALSPRPLSPGPPPPTPTGQFP